MNPNTPSEIIHVQGRDIVFSCMPIDETDPATKFKIETSGEIIIPAMVLREIANGMLRMLGEGW